MKKLKSNWITKNKTNRLYNIDVPIIGLTGGIATGKSTVADFFRDEGIPVIDADKLVKSIYAKETSLEFIRKFFPEAIQDNAIHFKTLREIAFKSPENQAIIENFIYAQMPDAFKKVYNSFPASNFIVYDVPLLFEKSLDAKIDVSICVYSPREVQLQRLIKRDHITPDLAEAILARQMDIEQKRLKADLTIVNLGNVEDLKENFQHFISTLTT